MTWNFHIRGSVDKANLQREVFHSLLLLGNHWFQASKNVLRVFKFVKRDQQTNWTLNLAQSSILKCRFCWSSPRSFLNFLLSKFGVKMKQSPSKKPWSRAIYPWPKLEQIPCVCPCDPAESFAKLNNYPTPREKKKYQNCTILPGFPWVPRGCPGGRPTGD